MYAGGHYFVDSRRVGRWDGRSQWDCNEGDQREESIQRRAYPSTLVLNVEGTFCGANISSAITYPLSLGVTCPSPSASQGQPVKAF